MYPRPPRLEFAELRLPIKLADCLVELKAVADEVNGEAIDGVELLDRELEKPSLGSEKSAMADENLTDEELLTIESVAKGDEVEDFS